MAPGTRHLILVRHGAYHQAGDHPRFGNLTTDGQTQARAAGHALNGTSVRSVVSSTLPRAVETAALIAEVLGGVRTRKLACLNEVTPDLTIDELARAVDSTKRRLTDHPNHRRELLRQIDPSGERLAHHDQACEAWRRLMRPVRGGSGFEIIVTHGNLIRWLVCRVLGTEPARWHTLGTAYAGITGCRISASGDPVLDSYNQTMHLDPVDRRATMR